MQSLNIAYATAPQSEEMLLLGGRFEVMNVSDLAEQLLDMKRPLASTG